MKIGRMEIEITTACPARPSLWEIEQERRNPLRMFDRVMNISAEEAETMAERIMDLARDTPIIWTEPDE